MEKIREGFLIGLGLWLCWLVLGFVYNLASVVLDLEYLRSWLLW